MQPSSKRRRAIALPTVTLLALAAACSDGPSEPADPLVVTATVANVTGPQLFDATPVSPVLVRCAVQVRLNVTGTGRSQFGDLTIYRFTGTDRTRPTDSTRMTPALVQQAFAASVILPGVDLVSAWTVDDSVPFTSRLVLRHRVEGSAQDETLTVDAPCGIGASTSAPSPTIANVSTTQGAGDLEPGDTIIVRFDATAPQGLWRTTARITGPCDVSGTATQRLQTTTQQAEFVFALPVTCELGVPIALQVTAWDAALRADTRSVATGLRLVDNVAPALFGVDYAGGTLNPVLFAGDSLYVWVSANDNLRLRWLTVGAASGPRDSIAIDAKSLNARLFAFAVRDSWAGAPYVGVRAIDRAGNTSEERRLDASQFQFYKATSRTSTGVTIPGEVRQLVVDRQGRTHVLQANQSRIVTLARGTLATVATTPFTSLQPVGIAATPSGDSIVVLQHGRRAFRFLDVRGATPVLGPEVAIQGLDAGKGEVPASAIVVTARNTAFMIVTATTVADWRVVELDLATGVATPRDLGITGVALTQAAFERSDDGRTVLFSAMSQSGSSYATCVRRWTLATATFTPCQDIGAQYVMDVDGTGATIVTNRNILDATLGAARPLQFFQRNPGFRPLVVAPDGGTVYAAHRDGLIRIRASDGATIDLLRGTASFEGHSLERLALSPDGTVAVMAPGFGRDDSRIVTMLLP